MLEPSVPIAALDLPPRAGLAQASRLGFRAVTLSAAQPGLRPRELDRSARRGLRAELRRLELTCVGVDLFVPPEHFVQADQLDRAIAAVEAALQLADDLEARVLFLRLPPTPDGEEPLEATRAIAAAAVGVRARVADLSLDGPALESVRSGGDLPIDIGLDTAAWLASGLDPTEGIVELGDRLSGIRLVDLDVHGTRMPVSMSGRLDLGALRTGLEVGGFNGALVADARGWSNPIEGLQQTLAMWRASGDLEG